MAVVIPLNNFPGPADDTVTAQTDYRIQGGSQRGDEATLTMHGAKYVNMPNPKVQPLHATGRHPGDVLTKFQPFPTTRERVKAKKLFISHGFWDQNHSISTHVPMGSGIK